MFRKPLFKPRSPSVLGHLDAVVGQNVTGWAALRETDQILTVQLEIDGVLIAEGLADRFREDLKPPLVCSENHGYALTIPEKYLDNQNHRISVVVKDFDVRLIGSFATFMLSQIPPSEPASETVDQGEDSDQSRETAKGYLDAIENGHVIGWAAEMGSDSPVTVELEIDGSIVLEALADEYRAELVSLVSRSGCHGFRLPIPPIFADDRRHDIEMRIKNSRRTRLITEISAFRLPVPGYDAAVFEALLAKSKTPSTSLPPSIREKVKLSVVIPTFNRGALLEETLRRLIPCASKANAEIIVIDDGSKDDTPERLSKLRKESAALSYESIVNGGPGNARNKGASHAKGDILVFLGDDVMPINDDFLLYHSAAHNRFKKRGQAVLGKVTWPLGKDLDVNFVMQHIQGVGQEQFGFGYMTPFNWYKWNLFYTSNISIKRSLVEDWSSDGFKSAFYMAAFEDAEFALRTSKRLEECGEKLEILYVPGAQLAHYHPYDVESFLRRQVSTGLMAYEFLKLHPGLEADLGLDELTSRLNAPLSDSMSFPLEHYLAVFEGLRSWAVIIESHYGLGSQNWHSDFLKAIFRLAYQEGFLRAQTSNINTANACRYMLETVRAEMHRVITTEALGHLPGFGVV